MQGFIQDLDLKGGEEERGQIRVDLAGACQQTSTKGGPEGMHPQHKLRVRVCVHVCVRTCMCACVVTDSPSGPFLLMILHNMTAVYGTKF